MLEMFQIFIGLDKVVSEENFLEQEKVTTQRKRGQFETCETSTQNLERSQSLHLEWGKNGISPQKKQLAKNCQCIQMQL